jgi:hypothetical protein
VSFYDWFDRTTRRLNAFTLNRVFYVSLPVPVKNRLPRQLSQRFCVPVHPTTGLNEIVSCVAFWSEFVNLKKPVLFVVAQLLAPERCLRRCQSGLQKVFRRFVFTEAVHSQDVQVSTYKEPRHFSLNI